MATNDACVGISPYFAIKDGAMEQVGAYLPRFVELTQSAKLRGPLADLKPEYWVLEYGFRK